eukprot:5521879-Pyramimonas_sp.AAC.1
MGRASAKNAGASRAAPRRSSWRTAARGRQALSPAFSANARLAATKASGPRLIRQARVKCPSSCLT